MTDGAAMVELTVISTAEVKMAHAEFVLNQSETGRNGVVVPLWPLRRNQASWTFE